MSPCIQLICIQPKSWDIEIFSKGETLGTGVSGIVELSPSNVVLKTAWPGDESEECRQDLMLEASIYKRLGHHARLVKILSWDPEECVLGMEYMPNGNLENYINQNDAELTTARRLRWAADVAEGLSILHAAGVLHCDLKPKNLLVDADLRLKIADFGSSSMDGSMPSGCAGTRYMPPGDYSAYSVQVDLFALGSTIYKIATGTAPYHEKSSEDVWPLFAESQFPDTTQVLCGDEISQCWTGRARSAADVLDANQLRLQTNKIEGEEADQPG